MRQEKRWIQSEVLFRVIEEQLAEGRKASFTVTGMSMWPLLCHGRDQVILEKTEKDQLKKGDIILYRISEGHYILHRMTRLEKETFQTTGDGNFYRDIPMPYESIVAKVCKIIRDGKEIDCDAWRWKLFFRIWMFLFPIRKWMFRIWFSIRKYIRK